MFWGLVCLYAEISVKFSMGWTFYLFCLVWTGEKMSVRTVAFSDEFLVVYGCLKMGVKLWRRSCLINWYQIKTEGLFMATGYVLGVFAIIIAVIIHVVTGSNALGVMTAAALVEFCAGEG